MDLWLLKKQKKYCHYDDTLHMKSTHTQGIYKNSEERKMGLL